MIDTWLMFDQLSNESQAGLVICTLFVVFVSIVMAAVVVLAVKNKNGE